MIVKLWILNRYCFHFNFLISIASGARKSKVSKENGMKACWLLEHAFSCLTILLEKNLWAVCPTKKPPVLSTAIGETPIKSTNACFPPIHPYPKTHVGLRVDLLSHGSVKKFTGASFFTNTHTRLNIWNRTFLTKSYRYLSSRGYLQWITCSPNVSMHTL